MKTKLEVEKELKKCYKEIQKAKGTDDWDTLNGWIHALEWLLKTGEN